MPIVTEAQSKIPFARVNHNKYMVTETTAYIGNYELTTVVTDASHVALGTSNWSGDYFTTTGGAGLVVSNEKTPQVSHNITFIMKIPITKKFRSNLMTLLRTN